MRRWNAAPETKCWHWSFAAVNRDFDLDCKHASRGTLAAGPSKPESMSMPPVTTVPARSKEGPRRDDAQQTKEPKLELF